MTDLANLKARIFESWNTSDYGTFGQVLEVGVRDFVKRLTLDDQSRVLDVACGTGNCSIPLAQRGANVVGVDIAPSLLEVARVRSAELGLSIQFDEGDAEALPYDNNQFDLITSSFGVIFAPRQKLAAEELVRVCQPQGTIALMAWTDKSIIGQLFATQAKYVPMPPNLPSNTEWGKRDVVDGYFGEQVDCQFYDRTLPMTFDMDAKGVVDFFKRHSRAMQSAFKRLDEGKQASLQAELEALWNEHNVGENGRIAVNAAYLEIVGTKR
ncbi:MAG: class I SAM-dependent methyltransferase [Chloroflexota bacterium]